MADLLGALSDTEAVICGSDLSAFGALTECQPRGVAGPDAMVIAGFANYEIAGVGVPPITTVDPLPLESGARCAQLLGAVLGDAEAAQTPRRIEITQQFLPQASTRRRR